MNALRCHNRFLQILCLVLAGLFILSACGKETPVDELTQPEETTAATEVPAGAISAPYTLLDAMNPFYMETLVNASLISLLFDPLFTLDSGFMPVPLTATSSENNGTALTVQLEDSLVFSDASPLTAADVVYSFEKAVGSPLYGESLKSIVSCAATGVSTVEFTLNSPDVNAVNLLTFPIVKAGTAETSTEVPIGAGRYVFVREDGRALLRANLRYAGGVPKIGTVRLREITESATLMHILNVGGIDCFYTDLSDGVAKRSYAGSNEVYLNELVFLGVNHMNGDLKNAEFRKAVSLSLSRSAIAANAFVSHARAALTPFNTSWELLSSLPAAGSTEADPAAADALLSRLGSGVGGVETRLTMLVSADADAFVKTAAGLIAEELSYVNITLDVLYPNADLFKQMLREGKFDLYLGQIRLTKNMDLSPFFSEYGAARYGMDLDAMDLDETYFEYKSGGRELETFLNSFAELMPFIPLCYRNGQFCYSRVIRSAIQSTEDRLFYNVEEWLV